jgi:hypothetical protein
VHGRAKESGLRKEFDMSSTLLMERTAMGMPGLGMPGLASPAVGAPSGMPMAPNWLMVPRCTMKVEKCSGGLKFTCSTDDKMACSMMQNLCTMLSGGMCSCCLMFNGMTVCCYNFSMGMCKCEMLDSGICMTCTSGDPQCCQMIQACCESISCCLEAGCTCCLLMNNTPLCCGYCDSKMHSKSKK